MKKTMCVILSIFLLSSVAMAGILPTMDQAFGTVLPNAEFALDRPADSRDDDENGSCTMVFENATKENYEQLDKYLKGAGCTVVTQTANASINEAQVSLKDVVFTVACDKDNHTITIVYPEGTRREEEAGIPGQNGGLLPLYNTGILPSVELALGRIADSDRTNDAGVQTVVFESLTHTEYDALDRYLIDAGCKAERTDITDGVLHATIKANDSEFELEYDHSAEILTIIYPEGTRFETEKGNYSKKHGLLPNFDDTFSVNLPNLRSIIDREPETSEYEDNSLVETYTHFTEGNYNSFSAALGIYGCSVKDYSMDGKVMTINLEKDGVIFTFLYDPENSSATIIYSDGTRPEPTATPASTATPAPTATPKPERKQLSEGECWSKAEYYFKHNVSWKNPSSVKIYGHTSTQTDDKYTFYIDYSAQNGFGGYNRDTYCIVVDAVTGNIKSAFG